MASKLEQYKKLYRQKYPSLSEKQITDLAKAALAKDRSNTSANDAAPTFGETEVDTSGAKRGVRVGFGLTDKDGNDLYVVPTLFPSFITKLSVQNPKAYSTILRNVYQATGTKYKDPNSLGTWLETAGRNLQVSARQDPTAASVSMESLISAGIVNRGAAGIFGGGGGDANVPVRQIYKKTKEDVEAEIEKFANERLTRGITEKDMSQQWYKDLRKAVRAMYDQGIISTQKKVRNPETGKMELQAIQAPQYSAEKIAETIGTTLEQQDPEAAERTKRLKFSQWLGQQGGLGR